jgi:isopropylmalate/homocitrate/citramalate synthase
LVFYLKKNDIVLTKEQFDEVFNMVKDFGRIIKGNLTEEDFLELVKKVIKK